MYAYMNYERIYNEIIKRSKNRILVEYKERHHILPKSLGGLDDKTNIAVLTAREHFLCHWLLCRMHKDNKNAYPKMVKAFNMMLRARGATHNRYVPGYSRIYETMRKELSIVSKENIGERNSQHGTMWVHNREIKQSKKVISGAVLEDGWELGRVIQWDKCKPVVLKKIPKVRYSVCVYCSAQYPKNGKTKFCSETCKKKISCKPCVINGTTYSSVADAALAEGTSYQTMLMRIRSKTNTECRYL